MNILSKLSIVVYRTCVVLFVALFATSLYAQGVLGGAAPAQGTNVARPHILAEVRNLISARQAVLNDENRPITERAEAFADLIFGGGLLINNSNANIRDLLDSIEEKLATADVIMEGDVLSIVKFDMVRQLVDRHNWDDAAEKISVLKNVATALMDVGNAVNGMTNESRIAQTERDRIRQALAGVSMSQARREALAHAIRTAEIAMSREAVAERVNEVVELIESLAREGHIENLDAANLKMSLYEDLVSDGVADRDERMKKLEDRLMKSPGSYELWRELTELRLIHLNMTRNELQERLNISEEDMLGVYVERVLVDIKKARDEHPDILDLAFLHDFYSGWINEFFGNYRESHEFFEMAWENATNERDGVRALAKATELRLKTR